MDAAEYNSIAGSIPVQPGIYKYFNKKNELIYVGKARNIRKRVSSYFTKSHSSRKTIEMVSRISRVEFTIVNNEHDALLLENSLIKEFKPLFNINLKDDKTYPYIVIKKEPFPRVFLTRRKIKDGSRYFGPFTSVGAVKDMLELIKENIPLRTCTLNLSERNVSQKKFKVCLEYHLGRCKGPCEALQTAEDYDVGIERIVSFLKGNLNPLITDLKKQMNSLSEKMEFEKAGDVRKRIENLAGYQSRSLVTNTSMGNADVFSILEEGDRAYVNYLSVNNGSIIKTKTVILEKKLEESKEEVLAFAIGQIRETFASDADEIIVPFAIEYPEKGTFITVPRSGDKKKLLELSEKNVNHFKKEIEARKMLKLEEKSDAEKTEVLELIRNDLHLPSVPEHIECFDNSNFQGSYPVAAMVCFRRGEPSKKDYRKFNIKTVEGINDFASMAEIVYRRYSRLIKEASPLPDLIIIDGGKGQLNAAMESIDKLGIRNSVTMVGLAKNEEEIFFPGDKESIKLPWNSDSLKLIRRIRDEVHRFGIGFHRNKRTKESVSTALERIDGVGKQTAELLLKHFRSVNKIRSASDDELIRLVGPSKAEKIIHALRQRP